MQTPQKGVQPGQEITAQRLSDTATRDKAHTVQPTRGMVGGVTAGGTLLRPPGSRAMRDSVATKLVIVKITGNASGGGKYNGRILTGTSTATASGTETQPEGMTVPAADNALVLNLEEDGLGTHWLETNSFAVGRVVGSTGGGSPLSIVEITNGEATLASAKTLGSNSEGTTTPDGTTWDRTVASEGPLEIWMTSRVVYDHSSGQVLYAMVRKFTYDAAGRLKSVTGETAVSVDATEAC